MVDRPCQFCKADPGQYHLAGCPNGNPLKACGHCGYVGGGHRPFCINYKEKPDIHQLAADIGRVTAEKNAAYGDSVSKSGEFLALLYPDGVKPEQYADMLLQVRIFDKLMRIATAFNAFGENPYRDITGYGLMGVARRQIAGGGE